MNKIIVVESPGAMMKKLTNGFTRALICGLGVGSIKQDEISIFRRHASSLFAGVLMEFYENDEEVLKELREYENNE